MYDIFKESLIQCDYFCYCRLLLQSLRTNENSISSGIVFKILEDLLPGKKHRFIFSIMTNFHPSNRGEHKLFTFDS